MRTETGIMKIFSKGFYLEIFPIKSNKRRFWTARITDKNKRFVKEFFDINRGFVKLKAFEWIEGKNQAMKK